MAADPGRYTYDTHMRSTDAMVVKHMVNDPTMIHRAHAEAYKDVRMQIRGHGYLEKVQFSNQAYGQYDYRTLDRTIVDAAEPENDFATAVGAFTFTASAAGGFTVPLGTRIVVSPLAPSDVDYVAQGLVVFTTDAALIVAAGASGAVAVTAEHPGLPHNIPAGQLAYLDASEPGLPTLDRIVNDAETTGGVDHQLTRATVYRALELVYRNLTSREDDVFNGKRKLYADYYKEEVALMVAGRIVMVVNDDGVESAEEFEMRHGYHRINRG